MVRRKSKGPKLHKFRQGKTPFEPPETDFYHSPYCFLYESIYKLLNYFHSLLWAKSGHGQTRSARGRYLSFWKEAANHSSKNDTWESIAYLK